MNFRSMPQYDVFKKGSKTYFNSSLFFPPRIRRDVFVLYGFVRTADNFVDETPQDECGFRAFVEAWERADAGDPSGDPIIDDFVALSRRRGFETSWTRGFLRSMAWDLRKTVYNELAETLDYVFGSAEVIGLYMSRILGLADEALPYARMLGRAMQYINFLRDIAEDVRLGRRYVPLGDSGLTGLSEEEAQAKPEAFREWFRRQAGLYRAWHAEGAKGYAFIPRRYLAPIETAEDMYLWTARALEKDPFLVYRRKVKPPRGVIRRRALVNFFGPVPRLPAEPIDPGVPGGIIIPDAEGLEIA